MENEENKQQYKPQQPILTKKSWWRADSKWFGGYIVAGTIWYYSEKFKQTPIDSLIVLFIAIAAGFFYYRLKSKIRVKNEIARIVITFLILEIIAGGLIGLFTSLANNWETIIVRTPLGTEIAMRDRDSLTQLNQNQKTYLADFQVRWDTAQNNIDDEIDSKVGYTNNIVAYKTLQKLNNERQDRVIQYFNQVSPILVKYSQSLVDAFSQLVKSDEKARNVYNDIFIAKINYYQAIIDNRPEAEISAKVLIVNNAVDKVSAVVQEGARDQQNYQKIYNDFFGS